MKKSLKIVLIVFAVIIVLGIIGNIFGDDDSDKNDTIITKSPTVTVALDNNTDNEISTEAPTAVPTIAPTDEPEAVKYNPGTYKVGVDIPAGEYVVFCDNTLTGYLEISSDSTGNLDSIIGNENFDYNSIVVLEDGQYFKITGAYAILIDEAGELNISGSGTFKIGTHLKAGEYKLECTDNILGYGYYEVDSAPTHTLDSIVTNENFEGNTYVTVSDGQYLKISSAKIVQ